MLLDLVTKSRSVRRFDHTFQIDCKTLRDLVELARLSPTGANLQPLKYFLSYSSETNALIFPNLAWAGYLRDWKGPETGEQPSGYIIILGDRNIKESFGIDPGIAAQSIMLGAAETGLGGCMIASVKKESLAMALNLPEHLEILLVLALGKPNETIIIESVPESGDIRYYRDHQSRHHVPKRSLDELIVD